MYNAEEYPRRDYESLMHFRISRILMICSNYDEFIMEEDGQIESRVANEYAELNMHQPPKFIWVNSAAAAEKLINDNAEIDMIISMFNETDKDLLPFASRLKTSGRNIPFVLLMQYSKQIRAKVTSENASGADYVFSWHGNADLILAIIKLFEDRLNADHDILQGGVRAILLVEDSIRYYSNYLPELYKLVLTQNNEFLRETLNEKQRHNVKRSRPKILLATCYEQAVELYGKYRNNFLGVITDVGMVIHKGDNPSTEKLDAGIDIVKIIREDDPQMPILMQSSQGSMAEVAKKLGTGFLRKYSRALFIRLSEYIKEEFGFGDFVFRGPDGSEYGRAADLQELTSIVDNIPDDVLVSNTSRNMFSKWFYARGLFMLAARFRSEHHIVGSEARQFIKDEVQKYHRALGRGIIAHFDEDRYQDYISFARLGEGSLGGKARGLAFLNKLIMKYSLSDKYNGMTVSIPRSIVISTEYFDEFIQINGLQYVIDSELSDGDVLSEFVASRLPDRLMTELRSYLDSVDSPLAIRSSSKLEDSNYQPFAGVYSTYMIPNTENKDQMLRMLGKAVKSVYASAYYNGSRSYIQSTGNLQSEEKMAVIIQDICGSEHDGLYYPLLSGVARSVNFYPIENEKAQDGIVNMVIGLGKTVVEGGHTLRFSPNYPKKILQLSMPDIALRDSQKKMYALDLRPGAFKISRNEGINLIHADVADIIKTYPYSSLAVSTFDRSDGRMVPRADIPGPKVVSFDHILKYGRFPLAKALKDIMEICRAELMCEVEMEFAADLQPDGTLSLNLLQVRPISQNYDASDVNIDDVAASMSKLIVDTDKALGSGYCYGVSHIVYVSPDKYDSSQTMDIRAEVANVNQQLKSEGKPYMLIGPGRWGSSDINLGVPVAWNEISEAKVIAECSIPGAQVEPSQGTHFFQNITSLGVDYLSINCVRNPSSVDFPFIESLKHVYDGKFVSVLETPEELTVFIDRNSNRAVIGLV